MTRKNDKRERLVDSAAELFWTRGFDATLLADIATAADVPLGNVYYYFKTKTELARAVADLFVMQSETLIASLNESTAEPDRKLQKFIDVLAGSTAARTERGCPIAKAYADFKPHDEIAARRAADALRVLAVWAQEVLAECGHADARGTAWRLISDWQGGIVIAHAFADRSHLEAIIESMRMAVRPAKDGDPVKG